MKSKSRKRLIVLVCAVAAIVGVGGGLYLIHHYELQHQLSHERAEGLDAVKQKNYALAVQDLGDYLNYWPN
ncbi:MAG TPA: hypothetical protein VG722_00035, partial [Tepidisphaeraceae bacterium]|nr:hypothetical protein [Tepidisphaeraceae bacterium]